MDMENIDTPEDEEFNLIDLLSFFLKYRKIIFLLPIIVTFIVALWVYVSPLIIKTKDEDKNLFRVSYSVKTVMPPTCVLQEMTPNNVAVIASSTIRNIRFLSEQNRIYPIFGGIDKNGYEYNAALKDAISDSQFNISGINLGKNFDIEMNVTEDDMPLFEDFVFGCIDRVNSELEDYIFPIIENFESLKDEKGNSKYPEIKFFKDSYTNFISVSGDAFILKNARKSRVKAIIKVLVGSFLVSLCLSFLINSVKIIKKDKKSSEKIIAAWKTGK